MADLSDFKRSQIIGACVARASVTKTTELFGVAISNVSKVMTAFEKEGKTFSRNENLGKKRKLSDRDRRTLAKIVRKNHKKATLKITVEHNGHHENPVSLKSVRRQLHKIRFCVRTAIRKPY